MSATLGMQINFKLWLLAFFKKVSGPAKYLFLLLSLEMLTWSDAFYGQPTGAPPAGIGWSDLIVAMTLLAGVVAINRRKWVLAVAVTLAVLTLGTVWAAGLLQTKPLYIAGELSAVLFLAFTACVVWHDIGQTEGVTADTLVGSVCCYALIAATWAFAYSLTDFLVPGSFQFPAGAAGIAGQVAPHPDYALLLYYSFVTLCSVGYGDVTPLSPAARMLATGEAVAGQFYMAVLVARLVSLHLEHARHKRAAAPSAEIEPLKRD
ncbi:MAG: two pore domain potassium channel family protein [Verrucomicrobia bacterium]|nr:two pore domain potassium channel family protein [Verrucomicrobiota bacterium]